MYTQTQVQNKRHSPGAIILTAVVAAGLITVQHMVVSVHDQSTQPVYADADSQGSIVVFETGYAARGLLDPLDATDITHSSQASWLDNIRESISNLRQDMMSLIPEQLPTTTLEGAIDSLTISGAQATGAMMTDTTTTSVSCEQTFPQDGSGHAQSALIRRALDHCLIAPNHDNQVLPDTLLTHDMMLIIADRAGFDVDLTRGSSQAVTRDDLKRFLDYLLASKQIDGVPAQRYNDVLTRIQYLTVVRDIIPASYILPEATTSSLTSLASVTPSLSQTATLTVAAFKEQLNKKLASPLAIMSYDATVMATPEVQQSILLDLINGSMSTPSLGLHASAPTSIDASLLTNGQSGIGVNKETLKALLGGLVENI